jgi:hypothetical protein
MYLQYIHTQKNIFNKQGRKGSPKSPHLNKAIVRTLKQIPGEHSVITWNVSFDKKQIPRMSEQGRERFFFFSWQ